MLSVKAMASLLAFSSIWLLMEILSWSYHLTYTLFGGIGLLFTLILALSFWHFKEKTEQTKKLLSGNVIGYFMPSLFLVALGDKFSLFLPVF